MDAAKTKVQGLIDENAVMLFSKSWCPYCQNSKRILSEHNAKYRAYELDQESDGDILQKALAELTGQRTVPSIFINKKHIGGNSDLEKLKSADLDSLLKQAGAV